MFTIKIAPSTQETGWNFDTKEDAEQFLSILNFIKVSEDEWCKPTNDQNYWPWKLLVIEEE